MSLIALSSGTKGTLLVLAGAVMISFSAVFVKIAHVGPTVSAFYRMAFGGVILLGLVVFTGKLMKFSRGALALMGICAVFFTCDLTVWHRSIFYVGPGMATILANFQVFFLAGVGFLVYKERLTIRYAISVPLAILGLILLIAHGGGKTYPRFYLGVFLGLMTALAYSAYLLSLRNLQRDYTRISALLVIAVISLLTAFFLGIEVMVAGHSFAIPDGVTWAALLGYGIAGQVLGWVFISKGIAKVEASRAGLILLLQPTLSFIWDILFFHRPTSLTDIIGALIAIAAIYMGSTARLPAAQNARGT